MDGITVPIYGDKPNLFRHTREVKHHNRYSLLSIPILIGKTHDRGAHRFGVDAGVSARFMLTQTGKSFDKTAEINMFGEGDIDRPFETMQFAIAAQCFYQYQLNERMGIRLQAIYEYGLPSSSPFHGEQVRLDQIALQSGLTWRLK